MIQKIIFCILILIFINIPCYAQSRSQKLKTLKTELNACDIKSASTNLEDCYINVGYKIIKTFYSKNSQITSSFNNFIISTKNAYSINNISKQISYQYTIKDIKKYVNDMLSHIESRI